MTVYIEFIATAITLVIGFIIGAYTFSIPNKWKSWEDVSIIYDGTTYTYSLLQVRVNNKGRKQFRTVQIVKYADLSPEDKEAVMTIIDRLNKQLK